MSTPDSIASTLATNTLQLLCQWDEELIARAIHDRSRRKDRAFVKVNCAAIPAGLLGRDLISSIIGLKNRQFFVNGHAPLDLCRDFAIRVSEATPRRARPSLATVSEASIPFPSRRIHLEAHVQLPACKIVRMRMEIARLQAGLPEQKRVPGTDVRMCCMCLSP
jgi:Sigma-54 interaction domain